MVVVSGRDGQIEVTSLVRVSLSRIYYSWIEQSYCKSISDACQCLRECSEMGRIRYFKGHTTRPSYIQTQNTKRMGPNASRRFFAGLARHRAVASLDYHPYVIRKSQGAHPVRSAADCSTTW